MTKALVIYDSKFGNTELVALKLAASLREQGAVTSCLKVNDVLSEALADADIIAVGGPTHSFGMSKPIAELLGRLKGTDLRGKEAVAFDTRFDSLVSGSAAKRIEAQLKRMGAYCVPRYSAFVSRQGKLKLNTIDEDLNRIVSALIGSKRQPKEERR